jgi:hypothetical protein
MNSAVLSEFTLFFQNEAEAKARVSEYMNSEWRKSADRKSLLVACAIGAVGGATGYVLQYALGLTSESYVGDSVTVGSILAGILLAHKRQGDAARSYLQENFEPQSVEKQKGKAQQSVQPDRCEDAPPG